MLRSLRMLLSIGLIMLFSSTFLSAQSILHGSVTKAKDQPLPEATVLLLNSKDSSLVKGSLTASSGSYSFEKIPPGNYIVAASYTGYKKVFSPVVHVEENEQKKIDALTLSEKISSLEAVTVTARKPLFEQKVDRMIINVANNITSAGNTVLEVLERSPGILVDRQNNSLSINGKNGVVVMINGRISYMPMSAVVQMLAGMPADNVEKVELITTPPANFDAEGNAGYINIVLKRNMQFGTNGSYTITQGYSNGYVMDLAGNFNHREAKWNLYGNYSFARKASGQTSVMSHADWNGAKYLQNYSASERRPVEMVSDLKLGFDYDLRKDLVAGVLVSIYNRGWNMDADNTSSVYVNGSLDTTTTVANKEKHPYGNLDVNANLQKSFAQGKLTLNFDYIENWEKNPVSYLNSYYNGNGAFLFDEELRSNKNTPVKLWVGMADLERKLSNKINLSAGIKATFYSFTNMVEVGRLTSSGWTNDPALTATYFLNESIPAAYSNLDWALTQKTALKFGLRYEYTNSNLKTAYEKDIVDRHYGKLFPTFFLSHTINENSTWSFAYNRRITRPTFSNLAPFVIFADPNTFFSGNPKLQPAITDNLSSSFTFKRKILSVSYSYEASPIAEYAPHVDPNTNKQTLAAENQDHSISYNASLSVPVDVSKWWSVQLNVSGNYMKMYALYNNESLILKSESLSGTATQNFTLPKQYTISLSGSYSSGGLFGVYRVKPLGMLDLGLQKKLKNNKSTFRLNYSNMLNTFKPHFSINAPEKNLVATGEIRFYYPGIRLTFTHNFGSDKVKAQRDRSTGSEDEKNRIKVQ